jgi:hypothetical protein
LRGALSLAVVMHLGEGVLIVNVLALTMVAASAALLWRRVRHDKLSQKTGARDGMLTPPRL